MANRDLTNFREVQRVIAEPSSDLIPAVAKLGQDIIRQSQEAKIVENMSAAQLDLNRLTNEFQTQYEGDPFNEQGIKEFREKRRAVLEGYGSNISPMFGRAWKDNAAKLANQNDLQVNAWGYKRADENTKISASNSMSNNFSMANTLGKQGASEVDALAAYAQSRSELEGFLAKNIGEVSASELLKDYEKDYLKSYIAGIAEADPQRAGMILANPELSEKFDTDERAEFASAIKQSIALKKFETTVQQTNNAGDVFELINDPNADYYTKRLTIDKMELTGQISTSVATKARRVLKSENDLDAITNTPVMSDIITRIYDLNAMQETNSQGYLEGIQNIREEIMVKQSDNELTATDARKLNNQLKTLTSAKMSDATQRVGMEFYEAQQKFEALPPEFRGRATRELFYRTHDKENISKETYNVYADDIAATINHDRRATTMKRLEAVNMPDVDFLKSNGITQDQVSQAAKNKNISEAEVIRLIKAKMVNEGAKPVQLKPMGRTEAETLVDLYSPYEDEEEE